MASLATAAGELAKTDAGDMPAVRLAFGGVSEKLIAVLEAEPAYAKDLHTFECPMAKGYKLWVQPDPKLENPYMGQKMLSCGTEVTPE
jgi:Cu(I)/Ag(I) efflux system membrane fusion protein